MEVVHESKSRVLAMSDIPDIRIAIQNGTNNLVVGIVQERRCGNWPSSVAFDLRSIFIVRANLLIVVS